VNRIVPNLAFDLGHGPVSDPTIRRHHAFGQGTGRAGFLIITSGSRAKGRAWHRAGPPGATRLKGDAMPPVIITR
jgi:hypothetical protein